MHLIIRKTKHRAWPVTVKQTDCDANGVVTESTATFVAHFAPFTEAQLEDARLIVEAAHPLPKGAEDDAPPSIALTLARAADLYAGTPPGSEKVSPPIIVGWGPEVKDESGASIPFAADVLREIVTGPGGYAAMLGIAVALGELRFGNAPTKNSNASAAPGVMPAAAEADPTS